MCSMYWNRQFRHSFDCCSRKFPSQFKKRLNAHFSCHWVADGWRWPRLRAWKLRYWLASLCGNKILEWYCILRGRYFKFISLINCRSFYQFFNSPGDDDSDTVFPKFHFLQRFRFHLGSQKRVRFRFQNWFKKFRFHLLKRFGSGSLYNFFIK
jgi:hypothetical protein